MRLVLALAAVALLWQSVAGAAISAEKERRQVVRIVDASGPMWDGFVREAVQDWNAVMPKGGPRLKYVRSNKVQCSDLEVCSGPMVGVYGYYSLRGRIKLSETVVGDKAEQENTICHELGHFVLHRHNHKGGPDSCLSGPLPDPGKDDVRRLRQLYGGG